MIVSFVRSNDLVVFLSFRYIFLYIHVHVFKQGDLSPRPPWLNMWKHKIKTTETEADKTELGQFTENERKLFRSSPYPWKTFCTMWIARPSVFASLYKEQLSSQRG